MNDLSWYVVHCHPRREVFVRDRVRDLGRDVFLPLISERRSKNRRRSLVPMFPGYVFSRLAESEGDLARVRWTHGVRRILGQDGVPTPIDDRVVTALRTRADRMGCMRIRNFFRAGERIRIVDGPLAGLIGIIERGESSPQERVCVLLELFHRLTRVELPAAAVGSASVSW
jgi:transcription antitermination factor NusG